jgi:hypothetical protein
VRIVSERQLLTPCRFCGQERSRHSGVDNAGKCPGSEHGDGKRYAPMRRRVGPASPLPGGGPWRISEHCSAEYHNSVRAAEGRNGRTKCTCPRGVVLNEKRKADWRRHDAAREKRSPRSIVASLPPAAPMPEPIRGICVEPQKRQVMDAAYDGAHGYPAAKEVCERCPVIEQCRAYILAAESTPGNWGGVWGGLTPRERLNLRRGR